MWAEDRICVLYWLLQVVKQVNICKCGHIFNLEIGLRKAEDVHDSEVFSLLYNAL